MEEVEAEGEVVAEEETAEEAVVSEEETTETTDETEVVSESEETTEEEILTGEELDSAIEEDVNALLSGDESLSEEFREKAKLVFEAYKRQSSRKSLQNSKSSMLLHFLRKLLKSK